MEKNPKRSQMTTETVSNLTAYQLGFSSEKEIK
jgi:hypothetical protein